MLCEFDLENMNLRMYVVRPCRCGGSLYKIIAQISSNGVTQYRVACDSCSEPLGGAILQSKLTPEMMRAAPVVRSYVAQAPPCERCGATVGTELHHWAPASVFHDFHAWPTSWLCKRCHQRWHRVMVGGRLEVARHAPPQ